jgi:Methyltransferase domain
LTTDYVRVSPDWLTLREPADTTARAADLVDEVRQHLPTDRVLVVHDLGCGTGSQARWLAVQLPGPQHWVMADRDAELLSRAAWVPPLAAADRARLTMDTRQRDVTRLDLQEVADADLVTASALLDMLTAEEIDRLVATCAAADCPALITLTVTGHVDLTPADPFDAPVTEAFNDHQRRTAGGRQLLGPDALAAAVHGFIRRGFEVKVRPSPWRLGPGQASLAAQWLSGWIGAACEQSPALRAAAASYARARLNQVSAGQLSVIVSHEDLLAIPRRRT